MPSGAFTGTHEAHERRDGDPGDYAGLGVHGAVNAVRDELAPALRGKAATDQQTIDALLRDLDGTASLSRLGANAVLGTSLAVCRAGALVTRRPLFRHIADLAGVHAPVLPMPMVNILSGGLHAGGGMDVQDFLAVPAGSTDLPEAVHRMGRVRSAATGVLARRGLPTLLADEGGLSPGCRTGRQALEIMVESFETAGLEPGRDVLIAIDVAAHSFVTPGGQYALAREGVTRSTAEMIDAIEEWVRDFPIVSVEDGLDEEDWAGWAELTTRIGNRVRLIGDDLFTTNVARLERGIAEGAWQRDPDQGQPERDPVGDPRRRGPRQGGRLRPGHFRTLRRDRGRLPGRSRRRHRRRADQDRVAAMLGPAGQVQPATAHRRGRELAVRAVARNLRADGGPVTSASREAAAQRFLLDQGLQAAGEQAAWIPLVGGVSSDLWRVDLPGRTLCVKAALPTLRVTDEWHAPVERNAVEYAWLLFAFGSGRAACRDCSGTIPAPGSSPWSSCRPRPRRRGRPSSWPDGSIRFSPARSVT